MLPLDRGLALLALAQTILATLRVASRTVELAKSNESDHLAKVAVMEGPLILPTVSVAGKISKKRNSTSMSLWDLTLAFRQCVRLSINRDNYDVHYEIDSSHLAHGRNLAAMSSPYALDAEELDADDAQMASKGSVERFKGVLALKSGATMPTTTRKILPGESEDYETVLKGRRVMDPMESDFYVSLSTDCTIQRHKQGGTSGLAPLVARVTSYAPDCFAELRSLYGVGETDFRKSILESGPYVSFQSNSKGAARAGGFFFFSRDGAYLVKTIKSDEADALLDMLPRYYQFMKRNGRRSLLARFCGMYTVAFRDEKGEVDVSHTFVVMNSVFPPEGSRIITEKFDLKGSTLGREVSIEERESLGRNAILKDLDLAREVQLLQSLQQRGGRVIPEYGINIGTNAKAAFMAQVRRDVQFLVECGVIDYSLIVGVAKMSQAMSEMDQQILDQAQDRLQARHSAEPNLLVAVLSGLFLPIRILLAPKTFPTSSPRPGQCVVDGGPLSQLLGHRLGSRAIYYFGLIDFLQPFNAKKAIEYRLKSIVYEQQAFSCVPPRLYAERFIDFLDRHIV